MSHKVQRWGMFTLFVFTSLASSLSTPVTFQFALPELEGAISLGIYDASGKLIRILAKHVPISSFQIGVNGLIGSWDGKTSEGKRAFPGVYEVRGFVVGPMKVNGIKFHFNDWVEGNNGPFPTNILSMFCVPGGGLMLLWKTLDGRHQLGYYSDFQTLKWVRDALESSHILTPPRPQILSVDVSEQKGHFVAFSSKNDAFRFSPCNVLRGKPPLLTAPEYFSSFTAGTECLPFPPVDKEAFTTPQKALALSRTGIVQEWHGGTWHRIPLPVLAKKVARGYGNTIWVIADTIEKREFLGQFSIRGEFLRRVHLPSEENTYCLVAPLDEDKVLVLRSKKDGSCRLLGYQFVKTPDGETSICEEFLSRALTPSTRFALSSSRLIPDAPLALPSSLEFSLARDALNPHPGQTSLKAQVESNTAWLATNDGLPLCPIATLQGATRALIAQKKQFVVLYCGNGAVVAEFSIQGIENLQPIHAGFIDWKYSEIPIK